MRLLLLLLAVVATSCGQEIFNETEDMGAGYAQYSPNKHNGSGSSSSVPPFAPLSIYTVYAPEIRQLSTIERRDLSNYVTKATRRLGKMLQVRKTDSLMVDCRQVGKKEVKDGYNFALFIDVNCKGNGQTLATAGACAREIGRAEPNGSVFYPYHQGQFQSSRGVTWLGRPLGGRISICLDQFKKRNPRWDGDKWVSTIMHEMSHALVYSGGFFTKFTHCEDNGKCRLYDPAQSNFTEPAGVKSYEIPGVVKKINLPWQTMFGEKQHPVHVLHTPTVREKMREYFSCPTAEGAELENQGGTGTAFSHLEKRIFEHETMGGIRTEVNAFSIISLAIFKDSGWYKVDWSKADSMTFGKGMGCDFITKSCGQWVNTQQDSYPYCKGSDQRCSPDLKAIETCNAYAYGGFGVPEEYSYFLRENKPNIPLHLPDYCPYYTMIPKQGSNRLPRCDEPADKNLDLLEVASLQIYSKTSRCMKIEDGIRFKKAANTQRNTLSYGCYETKCQNETLFIKTAKSRWYPCYLAGQTVNVERHLLEHKGDAVFRIYCPPCETICGVGNCTALAPDGKSIGDKPRKSKTLLDEILGKVTGAGAATGGISIWTVYLLAGIW